jgi:hypothetical protein
MPFFSPFRPVAILFFKLTFVKMRVKAVGAQQLRVRSLFNDIPLSHDEDQVGILDR